MTKEDTKVCFLIPVYNHGLLLEKNIDKIASHKLPVILIDDGSNMETKKALMRIVESHSGITCITLQKNSGKGAAMQEGFLHCVKHGFTHAFQIDADGQHDLNAISFFISLSIASPNSAIIGYPEYDDTVPTIRKKGRKITNFFVALESLHFDIKDAMIGFRIYPVHETARIYLNFFIGKRMTIEFELLTRLYWAGVPVQYAPVHITYPPDGISHFRMIKDNLLISLKHAQLLACMILIFPIILFNKYRRRY